MLFLLLITIMSMLVAAIMSAIAWHVGREEQRRAAARVEALANDIHRESTSDLDLRPREIRESVEERHDRSVPVPAGELFASRESTQSSTRLASVIAAVGVVALAVGSLVYLGSGARGSSGAVTTASAAAVTSAASRDADRANQQNVSTTAQSRPTPADKTPMPLELIALGHERDGDRLTVRGVVRNPSAAEVDRLTAVVFVFSSDGGFLASGRAPVQSSALAPGTESTFTVTVPRASNVARYRVSFRADDRVVPHVDRRELRTSGDDRQQRQEKS
jgi:hypothetical protein